MPAFNSPFVTSVRQLKHVLREMDLDNTGGDGGKKQWKPLKNRGEIPMEWPDFFKYPLVMTIIAMENGPVIDGLPIKNCDFPWLC